MVKNELFTKFPPTTKERHGVITRRRMEQKAGSKFFVIGVFFYLLESTLFLA